MKIAVGTTNIAKLQAVRNVFSGSFTIIECKVPSGVSEQPFSDEETLQGVINRAKNAAIQVGADIGIGLEGGVTETPFGLLLCNWGALVFLSRPDEPVVAGVARIPLPDEIAERLYRGEEMGPVMDEYCQKENIRSHEGAIGIFTNGYVDRIEMFTHVTKLLKGQMDYRLK